METLDFPDSFVACDLKIGRYRHFTVIICVKFVSFQGQVYILTNMTLAKGCLSETKSQVSNIRTIGHLVFVLYFLIISEF